MTNPSDVREISEANGTKEKSTMEFVSKIRPPSRVGTPTLTNEEIKRIQERSKALVADILPTERKTRNTPDRASKRTPSSGMSAQATNKRPRPTPSPKKTVQKAIPKVVPRAIPRVASTTRPMIPSRTSTTLAKPRERQPAVTNSTTANFRRAKVNDSVSTLDNSSSIANLSRISGDEPVPRPKLFKRPAYDTKGRLEDTEKMIKYLKYELKKHKEAIQEVTAKHSESQARIDTLEETRKSLKLRAEAVSKENQDNLVKVEELKFKFKTVEIEKEEKLLEEKKRHELALKNLESRIDLLDREKALLNNKLNSTVADLEKEREDCARLSKTLTDQTSSYSKMLCEKGALDACLKKAHEDIAARDAHISSLTEQLAQSQQKVASLEARVREEETIRRQLHNTIQELKGNIRVFCRVRPPIGSEKNIPGTLSHLAFPDQDGDSKSIELKQSKESSFSKTIHKTHPFSFDKVFLPASTQQEVFSEISQLVQSALDGYPVCIFAYGQTGSGKTFTMEGPTVSDTESEGMIPRAVAQIFENAEKLKEKGWSYQMVCQFVEIYNETLHDLLGPGDQKKHEIKHEASGKTTVTEVVNKEVKSPREVHSLLSKASSNRAVASTNCNERSSRSHSVFTMRLSGSNSLTAETAEGVLNLIDLAGSESINKSGSSGDRLKETQAINRSLSCLTDVIQALSNQKDHVPYRNSKLTYLLQNSLGGNSKTLMFVNVSPLPENSQETLFSLQFATKVNSCHIGTARKSSK